MTHELKTWPGPFEAVRAGLKNFEIRKADRPFGVGDLLRLREYDPDPCRYTGREVTVEVTYLVLPGQWGIPAGMCVMSIRMLTVTRPARRGR